MKIIRTIKKIIKKSIHKLKNLIKQKLTYKQLLLNDLICLNHIKILNSNYLPIRVLFNNLHLDINTKEEAFILKELYNDFDYYFSLDREIVVIDIGMNVGFTSLYLASKNNVKSIYSFEPVKETFEMAQNNFNLNHEISNKINSYNFGLGNENCIKQFIYSSEFKGSVGIRGLKSWNIRNSIDRKILSVEIRDASKVLKSIIKKNDDKYLVCKLDCEGAEYEIIPNLFSSGLMQHIGFFIIEYHDDSPQKLIDLLFKNKFVTIIKKTNIHLGLIYAFNTEISNK